MKRGLFCSMHWGDETSIKSTVYLSIFWKARDKISLHELIVWLFQYHLHRETQICDLVLGFVLQICSNIWEWHCQSNAYLSLVYFHFMIKETVPGLHQQHDRMAKAFTTIASTKICRRYLIYAFNSVFSYD